MAKILAHGATVTFNAVQIGGLTQITTPDRNKPEVQVTDSDSGGSHEFIAGIRDNGTAELEFIRDYDDAGQQELLTNADLNGLTAQEVVITWPSEAAATSPVTLTFDAFVQTLQTDGPTADDTPMTGSATLRVTGSVVVDLGT